MAYTFDEPRLGLLQIAAIDSGVVPPGNGTTAIPTPPNVLGSVVRAFDPTYGEGEFILLKGVSSTAVGSLVTYDGTTYASTLCAVTGNQARPVAVSMAANTAATTFSWYQIEVFETCRQSVVRCICGRKLTDMFRHRPLSSFRALKIIFCR